MCFWVHRELLVYLRKISVFLVHRGLWLKWLRYRVGGFVSFGSIAGPDYDGCVSAYGGDLCFLGPSRVLITWVSRRNGELCFLGGP